MKWILIIIFICVGFLLALRISDWFSDQSEWQRLKSLQPLRPSFYDPKIVESLPEPVQRFFNFAIKPGTPLYRVAEIEMDGQFSLGSQAKPNYQFMRAEQILACPDGFVWKLNLPGFVPISGSDSGQWTRFRIFELIPVARIGGDENHRRAAFGRYVAEAVFWTPAALLPAENINWEELNENAARVTVNHEGLSQSVDVEVDDMGKPLRVHFMRWSDANPQKVYQLQPFGGILSNFQEVQGFQIPFTVEAGNMYGTDLYFPFYKAKIRSVRFPVKL